MLLEEGQRGGLAILPSTIDTEVHTVLYQPCSLVHLTVYTYHIVLRGNTLACSVESLHRNITN